MLAGQFSPWVVQAMARLGAAVPFDQVPALLLALLGIPVSRDTVRRLTERVGTAQVAVEQRKLARLEQDLPAVPAGPAQQQVSADGAMVSLTHKEWVEVRTVASGTLALGGGEEVPHAHDIAYFSRLCSAHDFIRQAALPLYERGVAQAETVVTVMDGAEWLQEFIDAHCPDAIRILDFPHAVEYLATAAQAAFGAGTREASVWLDEWAPKLKRGDPDDVLDAVRQLPMDGDEAKTTQAQVLGYLTKRRKQIAYAQFRAAGYPIGSGMIESANKLVVEARLKGSGMHWERRNVTPMLALRGIACSGRWDQAWPAIWQDLLRAEEERRRQGRAGRRAARERVRQDQATDGGIDLTPPATRAPTIVDGRPTDAHPWHQPYDPILAAAAAAKT